MNLLLLHYSFNQFHTGSYHFAPSLDHLLLKVIGGLARATGIATWESRLDVFAWLVDVGFAANIVMACYKKWLRDGDIVFFCHIYPYIIYDQSESCYTKMHSNLSCAVFTLILLQFQSRC